MEVLEPTSAERVTLSLTRKLTTRSQLSFCLRPANLPVLHFALYSTPTHLFPNTPNQSISIFPTTSFYSPTLYNMR